MKKTLVKTVSYRALGACYGFAAGMAATGSYKVAFALIGAEALYKMGVYFAHERLWESKALKAAFA